MRVADIPPQQVAAYAAVNPDRMIEIAKTFPDKAAEIYHATWNPSTNLARALAIARAIPPDKAIALAIAAKGNVAAEIAKLYPDKAFEIATTEPDTAIPIVRALQNQALTLAIAHALPDKAEAIARNHPAAFRLLR